MYSALSRFYVTRFTLLLLALLPLLLAWGPPALDAQVLRTRMLYTAECEKYLKNGEASLLAEDLAPLLRCAKQSLEVTQQLLKKLRDNANEVRDATKITIGDNPFEVASGDFDEYVIRLHAGQKILRRWIAAAAATARDTGPAGNLRLIETDIDEEMFDLLGRRHLRQPVSAALLTGAVIAAGATDTETGDARSASAQALVVFSSKHVQPRATLPLDVGIRGRFGFAPVMAVTELSGVTGVRTQYQSGFVWDLGLALNVPTFGKNSSEVSVYGRAGQTMLGTRATVVENVPTAMLALPVDNGTGNTEWQFEAGVEANLFAVSIDRMHGEGSAVSPFFHVAFAYRDDRRLRPAGDFVAYGNSNQRGIIRFALDLKAIRDRRRGSDGRGVFSAGFGVDHEFFIGRASGLRLPAGTVLSLRGDVDLMRALQGDDK